MIPSEQKAVEGAFDEAFLHRLERLTLRTRRIAGLTGGRPGALRVPAADFVDYRPYSPGDDPRHIHWAAAARLDELYVKVGRVDQAAEVCLLLDTSSSMWADERKGRLGLELAAALGWIALHAGDRLTVIRFADGVRDSWGPGVGSGRGPALLAYLARPPLGPAAATRLEAPFHQAARAVPSGGLAVVVSDLWVTDDLDRALALLARPRWDVLLVQLLGALELVPEECGSVTLRDAETGRTLELVVDADLAAAYREALNGRIDRIRSAAAGRGARHELVLADWELERAVVPYLMARSVVTA